MRVGGGHGCGLGAFEDAAHQHRRGTAGDPAVAGPHALRADDVDEPGLVLQVHERRAPRRRRPLPVGHHPADPHPGGMADVAEARRGDDAECIEAGPYQLGRIPVGGHPGSGERHARDEGDRGRGRRNERGGDAKLSLTIFNGFSRNARIQKSKIELDKVNNSMEQLKTGISLQIASAKINLQNSLASLQTQRKNMELADEISRVTKIKYEQGVGSNLEVVTAESALKEAQVSYFGAMYDAMISKIDLDKASGNLK